VKQIIETRPTIEGAGVKLQRAFGFGKTREFVGGGGCANADIKRPLPDVGEW
jgi:hypothetical protein